MSKIFVKTFGCTLNKKETDEMCCGLNITEDFKKIIADSNKSIISV